MDINGVLASDSGEVGKLIKKMARGLGRKPFFPRDYEEDIEQEFYLALLKALPKYDRSRGSLIAFIVRVLQNTAMKMVDAQMAKKRCADRRTYPFNSVRQFASPRSTVKTTGDKTRLRITDEAADEWEEIVDRSIDLNRFVERCPDELKATCEDLATLSVTDAAKEQFVSRETIYSRLRKLRENAKRTGLHVYLN